MHFNKNILSVTGHNECCGKEIVTGEHSQVCVMSLKSGEETGVETHRGDQIIIFMEGAGRVEIEGETSLAAPDRLVFISAGKKHNVKNVGAGELKFYTIYSPPEHKKGWKKYENV